MNIQKYKKLLALSITGIISITNPIDIDANPVYNQEVNYLVVPKIKALTKVCIRKNASLNSDIVGYLNANQSLTLKGYFDDWYEVEYNGGIYYVYKDNVIQTNEIVMNNSYPMKKVITNTNVLFFQDESYCNVLGIIPMNTILDVYLDCYNSYFIKYNNQVGYIPKIYTNDYIYQIPNNNYQRKLNRPCN